MIHYYDFFRSFSTLSRSFRNRWDGEMYLKGLDRIGGWWDFWMSEEVLFIYLFILYQHLSPFLICSLSFFPFLYLFFIICFLPFFALFFPLNFSLLSLLLWVYISNIGHFISIFKFQFHQFIGKPHLLSFRHSFQFGFFCRIDIFVYLFIYLGVGSISSRVFPTSGFASFHSKIFFCLERKQQEDGW